MPARVALVAAALLVSLAACSTPVSAPVASPTPESAPPPFVYALTGEPAPPGAVSRGVIAVKVDDTAAGRPQQGVPQADLIIQEPVEGGLTRLMAMYESRSPDSVGPVRSVRTSDIGLVKPVDAELVASGGSPSALAALEAAGVDLVTEGADGYVRNPDRAAPYNLYVDVEVLRKGDKTPPRQPYLNFGEFDFPVGAEADTVRITFSPARTDPWAYDAKRKVWRRSDTGAPDVAADTLLILGVDLVDTGKKDAAGSSVPEVVTTGKGRGFLVTGAEVHAIRWSKKSDTAAFELTTESGLVLAVPPGRTWLALLPRQTGKVSFS